MASSHYAGVHQPRESVDAVDDGPQSKEEKQRWVDLGKEAKTASGKAALETNIAQKRELLQAAVAAYRQAAVLRPHYTMPGLARALSELASMELMPPPGDCQASDAKEFTSTLPPTTAEAARLVGGLMLAGAPLQPPRFHEVCHIWRFGQFFAAKDDPDRVREPWEPPDFMMTDPSALRARTFVEELALPESERRRGSFARVVHGVLDEPECAAVLARVNAKKFTPALLNVGNGGQQLQPFTRDGFRAVVDSDEMAVYLFELLQAYVPERREGLDGEVVDVVGLNNRCRILCYTPGQVFEQHVDGCYRHPSGKCSRVTVQLYLHDVPAESGGATTFIFDDGSTLPCQPRAGSVLLFSQDLLHEGSLLRSGLKYTLRTEVMYE